MNVSIVIPWYNTEWLAEKNLPKVVAAAENLKNNIIEIIVVDDASKDNSAAVIKKKFPKVKLIQHRINRGFSASVNTGVRTAKGDLVCLINSDVLPENNFLESVLKDFKDPKVFGVSLNEVGIFGWAKGKFANGFIEHETGGKSDEPHSTFWVSGGSGVFKRNIWMELGGLDEKVLSPFYWEDLDICYRAMKRGYKLLWEPDAKVYHEHETTISKLPQSYVQRIKERNQLLFIWKNLTSMQLLRKHISGLFRRIIIHPGYIRIVFMAIAKIAIVAKSRAKEAKEAKVSDEVIFSRFS